MIKVQVEGIPGVGHIQYREFDDYNIRIGSIIEITNPSGTSDWYKVYYIGPDGRIKVKPFKGYRTIKVTPIPLEEEEE